MKTVIIFLFLLIPLRLLAPCYDCLLIEYQEGIKPYERIWAAVCEIESGNNPLAYNSAEGAIGIAQIRKIKVNDYNRLTGNNVKHEDCYNPDVSKEIFMWHMEQFPVGCWEEGVKKWNGSGVKAELYLEKIKAKL